MTDPLKKFFPFDEYRTNQRDIIIEIANAFKSGKNNIILEAPTGTGKSVLGVTAAHVFGSAYFITAQKILQQQYLDDFPDIIDLKGRNAYPCWFMNEHLGSNKYYGCDRGHCVKRNKAALAFCINGDKCPYANQLDLAIKSNLTLFNFSSFLFQREMAQRFTNARKLLIIDEAHVTEQQIMNFVEIVIAQDDIDENLPELDSVEEYLSFFKKIELSAKLSEKIGDLTTEIENYIGKPISQSEDKTVKFGAQGTTVLDLDEIYFGEDKKAAHEDKDHVDELLKELNKFKGVLRKYNYLLEYVNKVRCVSEYNAKNKRVSIKPLYATYHTPRLLLTGGKNCLMMSATILNPKVFGESIGLDMSKTHYISVPHTFPVQNRLIHLDYAGPMNYASRKKTMPKMINKINKIMKKHANEKGIIHCQSFRLMQDIMDGVDIKNRERLINQKQFESKDEMLRVHSTSKNTVIIAPAMHEGLDLKNDLSRFQVIAKVPYPDNRENKQLKIRTEENWDYYLWLVSLKLIQSCGRSIRSETDYASTYILDESFDKFFNMADRARLLPDWFVESLVVD